MWLETISRSSALYLSTFSYQNGQAWHLVDVRLQVQSSLCILCHYVMKESVHFIKPSILLICQWLCILSVMHFYLLRSLYFIAFTYFNNCLHHCLYLFQFCESLPISTLNIDVNILLHLKSYIFPVFKLTLEKVPIITVLQKVVYNKLFSLDYSLNK